jgi:N-acyl-D-amino-acid deacylase
MKYSHTFIASDAASTAAEGPLVEDQPHPRTFGTFPRVLGHYVRELGILSLETAIAKMTSMPARRLALADRGQIGIGFKADLVIFDPNTILDLAGDLNPRGAPVGIHSVIVNGERIVYSGKITGALPGQIVRGTPGKRAHAPAP